LQINDWLIDRSIDLLATCVTVGKIITSVGPEDCQTCRDNEGVCHEPSTDDCRNFTDENSVLCDCPISRNGNLCQTVHGSCSCYWHAL